MCQNTATPQNPLSRHFYKKSGKFEFCDLNKFVVCIFSGKNHLFSKNTRLNEHHDAILTFFEKCGLKVQPFKHGTGQKLHFFAIFQRVFFKRATFLSESGTSITPFYMCTYIIKKKIHVQFMLWGKKINFKIPIFSINAENLVKNENQSFLNFI